MPDLNEGSENVTVHGIFNWILLLFIFSIITAIGNAKNNSTIYVYDYGYNGVLSSSNNRIDLNKNITI